MSFEKRITHRATETGRSKEITQAYTKVQRRNVWWPHTHINTHTYLHHPGKDSLSVCQTASSQVQKDGRLRKIKSNLKRVESIFSENRIRQNQVEKQPQRKTGPHNTATDIHTRRNTMTNTHTMACGRSQSADWPCDRVARCGLRTCKPIREV